MNQTTSDFVKQVVNPRKSLYSDLITFVNRKLNNPKVNLEKVRHNNPKPNLELKLCPSFCAYYAFVNGERTLPSI